ncbi:kinetochore-associated Ndc80 complex subunit spc24 [Dissophora globulifera]|nr:kinetochore-associated Ndc80 complex subunit spc24 [Dissophora globulifera]
MQQADATADVDLVSLIQDVASQFQRSGSDVQSIQRTIQDIHDTEKIRRETIQDSRATLQKLSRTLQLSRSKGSRQNVDPESLNHDNWMVQMDQKKFSVAKTIQGLDEVISSLEAEVRRLRLQSLELDSAYTQAGNNGERSNGSSDQRTNGGMGQATAGESSIGIEATSGRDEVMLDDAQDILDDTAHAMTVLRLQLYRGLGIEMLENELGAYSKARIRSSALNDVHVVKFDDQLSPFFQTNLIWDFAS